MAAARTESRQDDIVENDDDESALGDKTQLQAGARPAAQGQCFNSGQGDLNSAPSQIQFTLNQSPESQALAARQGVAGRENNNNNNDNNAAPSATDSGSGDISLESSGANKPAQASAAEPTTWPSSEREIESETASRGTGLNTGLTSNAATRPLILITDSNLAHHQHQFEEDAKRLAGYGARSPSGSDAQVAAGNEDEQVEIVDGIRYRIVAAVTKPRQQAIRANSSPIGATTTTTDPEWKRDNPQDFSQHQEDGSQENKMPARVSQQASGKLTNKFHSMRRKSSAFVSNLLASSAHSGNELSASEPRQRRLSIYEMTKSPPPETSLEIYLNDRRRSSTISAKQVQQQLEQQTTFEINYNQRQLYYKDLNKKLINQDKKLLNVVANRGQIHRHSVDIAQLPLQFALASGSARGSAAASSRATDQSSAGSTVSQQPALPPHLRPADSRRKRLRPADRKGERADNDGGQADDQFEAGQDAVSARLVAIRENKSFLGKCSSSIDPAAGGWPCPGRTGAAHHYYSNYYRLGGFRDKERSLAGEKRGERKRESPPSK